MTTPREQLVKIMQDTLECDLDEGELSDGRDVYGCSEHEADATDTGQCEFATYIADAIIAAGWTPPPTETLNPTLEN